MTTAETAIVLDLESDEDGDIRCDDGEEEVIVVKNVIPSRCQNEEQEEKVRTLVQILQISRDSALELLEKTKWNMEEAIALTLDGATSSDANDQPLTSSPTTQDAATAASSQALKPFCTEKNPQQDSMKTCVLSQKWRSSYEKASTPFVDPEFPPSRSSLDGRKCAAKIMPAVSEAADSDFESQSQPETIKCHCGIPATSKKVQSDGPNYGRFYLACGRSNHRKRPRNTRDNNDDAPTRNAPTEKTCKFFQWDDDGSLGGYHSNNNRWAQISWHPFVGPSYVIAKTCSKDRQRQNLPSSDNCNSQTMDMGPDQIRQGALGNCWFLSALAVVAEKPNLLRRLLTHIETNEKGCYEVNLCLDGKWTPVIVDAYLPVVTVFNREHDGNNKRTTAGHQRIDFRGMAHLKNNDTIMALPAFCAIPKGVLWPALVEKAYAKAHGSYSNLSGGFIAEGLADLTGAPTETIVFEREKLLDPSGDDLWVKMLSFTGAGFLMGVATNRGGDGLVGCHAYSVLKVLELHDRVLGAQPKLTSFFSSKDADSKISAGSSTQNEAQTSCGVGTAKERNSVSDERQSIRLVRIRNPWGKKEWTGAFSSHSENWTKRLRKELGQEAWSENDGTFWMTYHDVVTRFHHMDICKTREGWMHQSFDACFDNDANSPPTTSREILSSSRSVFKLNCTEPTWAYVSLIQPKKRANTTTRYWYSDLSMVFLKRSKGSNYDWCIEAVLLDGVTRRLDKEIFLDPSLEYCVIPFAGMPKVAASTRFPYRLAVYSSHHVQIQSQPSKPQHRSIVLKGIHSDLLKDPMNARYDVSSNAHLICSRKAGCLYFLVVNNSKDTFLSLLLNVDIGSGTIILFGRNEDTHDIAPQSQKILLVVASSGKRSTTTELKFKYMSDEIKQGGKQNPSKKLCNKVGLGSTVDVSFYGSSLVCEGMSCFSNKGEGSVDVYSWIHQVGSMTAG